MKALILAAGLGTRLKPFKDKAAKPSLPVVGIPVFWYGAWHLKRELQIEDFMMNMGHAPESLKAAGNDLDLQRFTGITFTYSDESKQILGSSGALAKLSGWIGSDQLAVCNGDIICFPSWKRMVQFHRDKKALLTLHVRMFSKGIEPYTDIEVDAEGKVTALGDKKEQGIMFTDSYLFESSLLSRIPIGTSELRPTLLEPLIREGKLFAYREDVECFDTGTAESYFRAQFKVLERIPKTRELIEVKMRESPKGCWVPRDWNKDISKPQLESPVVLTGNQEQWATSTNALGPYFVGIAPPTPGTAVPSCKAIVFSSHVQKF